MGLTAAQETDEDVLRTLKVGTQSILYSTPPFFALHAPPSTEALRLAHDSIDLWPCAAYMELTHQCLCAWMWMLEQSRGGSWNAQKVQQLQGRLRTRSQPANPGANSNRQRGPSRAGQWLASTPLSPSSQTSHTISRCLAALTSWDPSIAADLGAGEPQRKRGGSGGVQRQTSTSSTSSNAAGPSVRIPSPEDSFTGAHLTQ